jgi:hypothetical protein
MQTRNPWALSLQALELIEQLIKDRGCKRIIECGSGESTKLLARLERDRAIDQWLSLEHDRDYYGKSCGEVKRSGGTPSNVFYCPITDTEHGPWYGLKPYGHKLIGLHAPFDLLIVDGPPGHLSRRSRYPAVPILRPYLSPDCLIILDDVDRADEAATIALWCEQFDLMVEDIYPIDTGLALLKIKPA